MNGHWDRFLYPAASFLLHLTIYCLLMIKAMSFTVIDTDQRDITAMRIFDCLCARAAKNTNFLGRHTANSWPSSASKAFNSCCSASDFLKFQNIVATKAMEMTKSHPKRTFCNHIDHPIIPTNRVYRRLYTFLP